MRDDPTGGTEGHQPPEVSAGSLIAILAWRLRLCGSAVAIAFVMAGESVALLFTASLVVAALLFCAGSALARLELRIRTIRMERRR